MSIETGAEQPITVILTGHGERFVRGGAGDVAGRLAQPGPWPDFDVLERHENHDGPPRFEPAGREWVNPAAVVTVRERPG